MRLFKCRCITDAREVEDSDVGLHAWPQQPALCETETLRWKRRHLPNGVLQRNHVQVAHVNSKDARESAIVSRVRARFAENGNSAIRRNHCCRMSEDSPKIFFGYCVKDARTVALLDDPHRGFGGVRNG